MRSNIKKYNAKYNEFWWGWLFVAPTTIGLVILNIIPIFQTIYQSFFRTGDFGRGNIFIGFDHYVRLLQDSEVWQALFNTFQYVLIEVPISVAISLVLAVLLNKKMRGRSFYRTVFFLPMVVAPAAVAMVWRWIFNANFGLLNNLFGLNINWLSNPNIAIYSIAIIGIWSIIGYNMILFLAGLQEVPKDFYEAAQMDGASATRQFFSITIPLISPTLFFVFITRIIAAFQLFDFIFMVMDTTNPALPRTQSLVYLFYRHAFTEHNMGYGSAIVVLLLSVIMLVTVGQMMVQKKWVHYH